MTDTTINERRSSRDFLAPVFSTIAPIVLLRSRAGWLASVLTAIVMMNVLLFDWWVPLDNRDPGCQPGQGQITQQATPDTLGFCVPGTILEQGYRVTPPQ